MPPVVHQFQIRSTRFHITYKNRVQHQQLLELFATKGAVKFFSIVHEVGDLPDDSLYAHTHAIVRFTSEKNFTGNL
jgi:hypothetical protein